MAGVNKVTILGNVGKDPETRFLPNGGAVTNLTMATSGKISRQERPKKKLNGIVSLYLAS